MRFRLGFIFSLLATVALAQNGVAVKQSGNVTPNTIPWWITSGVIGGGVTSADSPITSFGVTNNGGQGFCVASQRITAAGRQLLCFGAKDNGPATISLQNYGTDTAQTINMIINGTTYPFPFVLSGVVGPGTSTVGDLACWNNTTGTLLKDCGTASNGVVSTNSSGVPSTSSTLPGSLIIPNPTVTGALAGSASANFSTLLLQPATGPLQAFATIQNLSGGNGSSILQANQVNILSDNYNAGSNPGTAGFAVNHTLGGTSMQGGRNAISGTINLTSASASANPLKEYVAITGNATASANDGGTTGTPAGAVYGSAFVSVATSAATNLVGVKGSESGVGVRTSSGNAPSIVANWSLVQLAVHAASGKNYDASLMLSNAGGIGMLNGIDFNSSSGAAPVGTTGCLICTHDSATVAKGIDFSSYTISGNAFKSTGFAVDGSGDISGVNVAASGPISTANYLVTPVPTTETANYSMAVTDSSLIFNGAGSLTLTLQGASSFPGRWLTVKTVAAQAVVSASSNVVPLIGGSAGTAILAGTAGKWARLQSDGTSWIIMEGN